MINLDGAISETSNEPKVPEPVPEIGRTGGPYLFTRISMARQLPPETTKETNEANEPKEHELETNKQGAKRNLKIRAKIRLNHATNKLRFLLFIKPQKAWLLCEDCWEVFSTEETLHTWAQAPTASHQHDVTRESVSAEINPRLCVICDQMKMNEVTLLWHMNSLHEIELDVEPKKNKDSTRQLHQRGRDHQYRPS